MLLIDKVLKHKKLILFVILVVALLSGMIIPLVHINYDLTDYLPADVPSTIAMDVIKSSFDEAIPNVNVFIPDVTIPQALDYKKALLDVHGVSSVLWLDDVVDIYQPLQTLDLQMVEAWYKDGDALFMVAGDTKTA